MTDKVIEWRPSRYLYVQRYVGTDMPEGGMSGARVRAIHDEQVAQIKDVLARMNEPVLTDSQAWSMWYYKHGGYYITTTYYFEGTRNTRKDVTLA